MNMASLDDTYFDFTEIGVDTFRNHLPMSGFPPSPNDGPLFEGSDTHFFVEDEAVLGLKSYQQSCGSLSPSANSYTSDDMPATPLSSVAETTSFCLQRELETDQTVLISSSYSQLLDQFECESGGQSRGQIATQGEQTRDDVGPVHATDYAATLRTKKASPTAVAGREQTPQKKTVNAVAVKSTSPPSSRPAVTAARGSSSVRQDKNNLPVAKSDVIIKVGVKRKTVQGKEEEEEEEAKKVKICGDSSISRNQKNAIAARENRLKKKMEFEELKRNGALLQEENQCLRTENSDHIKTIRGLEQEVEYYKSVLFNQSSLAIVLQSLNPKPKLKLSSSVGVSSQDQVVGIQSMSGGVCLHVNGTDASIEWCSKCSMKAQASFSS